MYAKKITKIAATIFALAFPTTGFAQDPVLDFQRDIVPIFTKHCLKCHSEENPRSDFVIQDRDIVMDYVEPGSLQDSSIWVDYLTADPNAVDSTIMPPVKSSVLSRSELGLVALWISEGADWPADAVVAKTAENAEESNLAAPKPTGFFGRLWAFQGYLHPATVHFPIALLSISAAAILLSFFTGRRAEDFGYYCLIVGAISSVVVAMMGWSFAITQGYGSWTKIPKSGDMTLFWHRWLGVLTVIVSLSLACIAFIAKHRPSKLFTKIWKYGVLGLALLVGWVGHQGGEMTWGETFFDTAIKTLLGQ